MEKSLVIINGLVVTLDVFKNTGYFNLVVKNGKIHFIDFDNELNDKKTISEKYPDFEIYDAANKIIIPALYNSNINSSYSLSKLFFRNSNYENFDTNVSLKLIDSFFKDDNNINDLFNLLKQNYLKSLLNGEVCLNETSSYISEVLLNKFIDDESILFDHNYYTIYENELENYFKSVKSNYFKGFQKEETINNYSLSNLKRSLSNGKKRMFLEVLHKADSAEEIQKSFGKSFIKVLLENELLNSSLILSNPIYLNSDDIKLLYEKDVNVVFCPTDFLKLSKRNIEFEEYLKLGGNIAIGTGYLGNDIFSELKTFAALVDKNYYTYDSILRMATVNPSTFFNGTSYSGCIAKDKDANLVCFELSDLRNLLNVPEIDSDRISEFIIENLTAKDISDVLVKGSFEVKNYSFELCEDEGFKYENMELAKKIYEVGKYYEFKNKYITRVMSDDKSKGKVAQKSSRVDKDIFKQVESFEESFETLSEEQLSGESDFHVIGTKETELINISKNFKYQNEELLNSMSELESFDEGLKFIDEEIETEAEQVGEEKKSGDKVFGFNDVYEEAEESKDKTDVQDSSKTSKDLKKLYFDDFLIGDSEATKDAPEQKEEVKSAKKETKDVKFKKGKLKFGFSNEEDKS